MFTIDASNIRKTNRADIANDVRLRAVGEVITDKRSCYSVAKQYEIP